MAQGFLCKLALFVVVTGLSVAPRMPSNSEGDVLHTFRRSISDPPNVLQSWDPTLFNLCTWFHITCNQDNHVTRIDLGNSNLSDSLLPELGRLEHLQYLEFKPSYRWSWCNTAYEEDFGNAERLAHSWSF